MPELGPVHIHFDLGSAEGLPLVLSTTQGIEPWDDFVYCLLLRIQVDGKQADQLSENMVGIEKDRSSELFCLVLRQLPNGDFYRVGYLEISLGEDGKGWLKVFEQAEERTITII
jgi:hypothetical protein